MKIFYENDAITPVVQEHITAQQVKQEEGKEIKNPYLSFLVFFGIILFFTGVGYWQLQTGDTLAGVILLSFMAFFAFVLFGELIQKFIQRKVAMMMNTRVNASQQIAATEVNPPQLSNALIVPPFQLNVYEQNELKDAGYSLNINLTEDKNIFNGKPLRIFYFFNFYSSFSLVNKVGGGWQRHGPVYFLGSPQDISFGKFRRMFTIKKIMQQLLLTTPGKLAGAMDGLSEKPLPPRTKGLMGENYYTGAYPTNTFYCTDAIWQQCVALLFAKTDIAIIDACDYTKERAGLQWEIGQIINHIATEDFVVIINSKTDLVALGESFRNSWKQMNATSPNNRQKPGPVRFIFHQRPAHTTGTEERAGILHQIALREALSNDKIIALMLQQK